MDDRGGHRAPYGAVLVLTSWAARNWPLLDGQLQADQIDIEDRVAGPANRFYALLHARFHALISGYLMWADKETRPKLEAALEVLQWPEVAARDSAERQDREARAAMEAAGISIDIDAAIAARMEMLAAQAATDNNEPVLDEPAT